MCDEAHSPRDWRHNRQISDLDLKYESLDARKAFVAKPTKIWQGRPWHRACEDWQDVADEPLFVTHRTMKDNECFDRFLCSKAREEEAKYKLTPLICIWTSLSCGPTSSHTSASDLSWSRRSPLANGPTPSGTRFDNSFSSPSPSLAVRDLLAAGDVCLARALTSATELSFHCP